MYPPAVGRNVFRRGGSRATILISAAICVSACGGAESSAAAASETVPTLAASESVEAVASPGAGSIAPLGSGFIMVSERSQLRLEEPSYLEQSGCMQRVSDLRDAVEFADCMEIPRTAICLQVTVGYREADRSWECFLEPIVCDDRTDEHDVIWQLVKDARAILHPCAERELATMFASM
jgi:hypothetical protein